MALATLSSYKYIPLTIPTAPTAVAKKTASARRRPTPELIILLGCDTHTHTSYKSVIPAAGTCPDHVSCVRMFTILYIPLPVPHHNLYVIQWCNLGVILLELM